MICLCAYGSAKNSSPLSSASSAGALAGTTPNASGKKFSQMWFSRSWSSPRSSTEKPGFSTLAPQSESLHTFQFPKMISTKTFSLWGRDPDDPAKVTAVIQRQIGGEPVNWTVNVPVDPAKPLDPNKPLKVRFLHRRIIRVWQP